MFWDRLKFVVEGFVILMITLWCLVNGFFMLTTWAF